MWKLTGKIVNHWDKSSQTMHPPPVPLCSIYTTHSHTLCTYSEPCCASCTTRWPLHTLAAPPLYHHALYLSFGTWLSHPSYVVSTLSNFREIFNVSLKHFFYLPCIEFLKKKLFGYVLIWHMDYVTNRPVLSLAECGLMWTCSRENFNVWYFI